MYTVIHDTLVDSKTAYKGNNFAKAMKWFRICAEQNFGVVYLFKGDEIYLES